MTSGKNPGGRIVLSRLGAVKAGVALDRRGGRARVQDIYICRHVEGVCQHPVVLRCDITNLAAGSPDTSKLPSDSLPCISSKKLRWLPISSARHLNKPTISSMRTVVRWKMSTALWGLLHSLAGQTRRSLAPPRPR
jgi:hypothetical protein